MASRVTRTDSKALGRAQEDATVLLLPVFPSKTAFARKCCYLLQKNRTIRVSIACAACQLCSWLSLQECPPSPGSCLSLSFLLSLVIVPHSLHPKSLGSWSVLPEHCVQTSAQPLTTSSCISMLLFMSLPFQTVSILKVKTTSCALLPRLLHASWHEVEVVH